jgi:hypothetical protein
VKIAIKSPLSRRETVQHSGPTPLESYREQARQLSDAGGAYLVLPVGLLQDLPVDLQQHLVNVLCRLAAINPTWVSATTYQVLPWARVRAGDLGQDELSWHGITTDVDPGTGTATYSRGGSPLSADTVLGHRPALDTVPAPTGARPGARPALLPATPGAKLAPAAAATGLRTQRATRMLETHRRRNLLAEFAPTADHEWTEAIVAADPLWGKDEDWKMLIDPTTKPTVQPSESKDELVPVDGAVEPTEQLNKNADIETDMASADPSLDPDEAELAALEADLQGLYRP